VIIGATGVAAVGAAGLVIGIGVPTLALGLALFGAGIGTAMTATYTAAGSIIPAGAHGAGFGLLSSASLTGLAVSPVVAGALGATTFRGVFVVDVLVMALLATIVRHVMASGAVIETPAMEDA
jgi:MFS family permease